ncbi:MAG: FxsA family protein [Nitrospirae bacterium]|nr:MAG: FxsA family protein [Nitrospirota bacterium]
MSRLFLLFLTLPLVELYLLIRVGRVIGAGWTVALVVLTAVVGAALAKAEGLRTLAAIQSALVAGRMPTEELVEGAMILVAGVVLLTPGFLTDAAGLLILFPPTRRPIRRWLLDWLRRRAQLQAGIIDVDFW